MKVFFPERIIDRHVGGNTTYGRHLEVGLRGAGVETGRIPSGNHAVTTMIRETVEARKRPRTGDEVLHYLADTGPVVRTTRPSVVTVHGVASRWIHTARTPRQEKIWRTRVARAIASCDQVLTVSESSADDVEAVFEIPRAAISVIPHGIEVGPRPATPMSPTVELMLPDEFILYVGNIEPRKNLTELVKAMSHPSMRELGVKLVIAGKPAWNAGPAMAAIEASPEVIYLGFVSDEDRYHLMQKSAAFVFPSLYEGFGFPVLEAMAVGAPVICTDRGSLAEVAGPARRLPGVDFESIAVGVSSALTDGLWIRQAGSEGRDWAANFTWHRSVEAHVAAYGRALSCR